MSESARIRDHFAPLTDLRRREVVYPLIDIITIAPCAVIAGADDFVAIAECARKKRTGLSHFLDLSRGVLSHDRFNAIFAAIKPAEFEQCLTGWITAPHEVSGGQVVAIDGRALRRSYDKAAGKPAIHVEGRADYVLAVKANRPTLHAGIAAYFLDHLEDDFARVSVGRRETKERGHGRAESRTYYVCDAPADLPDRARRPGLRRIGVAIGETTRDGKSASDVRHYILSRRLSGKGFAAAVRSHRDIENSRHWSLDVTFGEDQSRIRKGRADVNFSILRRTSLSLLKNNHDLKVGIKNERLAADWDDSYLEQVLFGS